ncbi:MAG: hypothetical protein D6713_08180 [Deltaproteobacteria bacterium]|nr:MAG: hypothetical protein D6713_08180 [Deltaproteobacteria bacterium]
MAGKRVVTFVLILLLVPGVSWSIPSATRFFDFRSGRQTAGIFTSFSDDVNFFFGQVRIKPTPSFEVGLKGGAADVEGGGGSTTGAYIGVDAAVDVGDLEWSLPGDIYLLGGFSSVLKSRRALNEVFIGGTALFDISSSDLLTIRGALGGEVSLSGGSLVDDDDTDLYATAGLTFDIGEGANFFIQVKAGTEVSGGIGINFEF